MKTKPLMPMQPATQRGERASPDLLEVIDRLHRAVEELQGKLDAIAAVTAPSGGATVDAESRAAISAIIAAAG